MINNSLWYRVLNEREVAEIQFANNYADFFHHGTSGHLGYIVIAKLARLLDLLQEDAMNNVKHDEDYIKTYLQNCLWEEDKNVPE